MGLIHEDKTYALKIRESANDGSDFPNPDADYRVMFLGEDGEFHLKDSAGAVTDIGGGAPDAHAASHQDGGSDEISLTGLAGESVTAQPPKTHASAHEDGGADELEIVDLATAEMDDALVLAPDGAGGVEFRAEAGGGGAGASDDLKQRANSYNLELDKSAGTYIDGSLTGQNASTTVLGVDSLYFVPIYIPKAITVDRIGINCTANAGAGDEVRMGFYESGADGLPGALLLDAGTVAVTTNGGKEITISQALSADTVYWLALFTNATASITVSSYGSAASPNFGLSSLTDTAYYRAFLLGTAYAVLPDPAGAVAAIAPTQSPSIRLRVT